MTPVEIKLYQTASEPTMVEKTLVEKATVKGYFKQVQDITAPVIDLAFNDRDTFNLYFNSNYAYIALFNRYYFISRKEVGMNNILSIYMDEDVLMSFKNEIYNLVPLVTRQASSEFYNKSLIDSAIPISTTPKVTVIGGDFFKWGKIEVVEENDLKYITYRIDSRSNDFFSFNGDIVMQCFSNVEGTSNDIFCNGIVSSNRYYDFSIKGFEQVYKAITAPTFWQSMEKWFSDFSQAIMDIQLLPYNIKNNSIYTLTEQTVIQFMQNSYTLVDNEKALMPSPNMYFIASTKIGWVFYKEKFESYLSTYEVVLPYIGKIELPPQLLSRFVENNECNLYVYLIINPSTWKGRYLIYSKDNLRFIAKKTDSKNEYAYMLPIYPSSIVYQSDEFNTGASIPMGSTDKNQKNLGILTTGIAIAASVATGGIAGGALAALGGAMSAGTQTALHRTQDRRLKKGSAKYNERMSAYKSSLYKDIAGSSISFASNTLEEIFPLIGNSTSVYSSAQSSVDYYSLNITVDTIKTEPQPEIPSNYYELYGGVCNLTVPLSTLKTKGYTKCANVHMTGFTNATSEEIAEIESLLLSGVIL